MPMEAYPFNLHGSLILFETPTHRRNQEDGFQHQPEDTAGEHHGLVWTR